MIRSSEPLNHLPAATPAHRRRSTGATALVLAALVTAGVATGCGSATATAERPGAGTPSTTKGSTESSDPANAICEDMTRTNVANQLGTGHVIGKPVRTKVGDVTTCTYKVTGGSLVMSVDKRTTDAAANTSFERVRSAANGATEVPNLGGGAFTDSDGTTVTIKDNKVLTVDPTLLPAGNDRTQIAQSLSFEILTCWTH